VIKAWRLQIACDFHNGKGLRRLDAIRVSLSNMCDLGVRGKEKRKGTETIIHKSKNKVVKN
jgi:hypothetical protein